MAREQARDWIDRVRRAERAGQYLTAADRARKALAELGEDVPDADRATLGYHLVRSMARGGAADRAAELYNQHRIWSVQEADHQSLGARILKDKALLSAGAQRTQLLLDAARAYEKVYEDYAEKRSYNAVNAATLYLLAGDERADRMARAALEECARESPADDEQRYWHAATVAEAKLVLGESAEAADRLNEAGALAYTDYAGRASTRKQLKLICEHAGIDTALLDGIANPDVVFFAGHIIAPEGGQGRFPAGQEASVRAGIEQFFDTHNIAAAFGSLAAGTDIMVAEACIARDRDLGIILPFQKDDFVRESVAPAGPAWVARFDKCMDWIGQHADSERGSVTYATDGAYLDDDSLYTYCAHLAMGLAMVRADNLDAGLRMLAVYDGKGGSGVGTDGNIEMWRSYGLPVDIIPVEGNGKAPARAARPQREIPERVPHAMLFGDVAGFSALREEHLPHFHAHFMARLSEVLESFGDGVLYLNSWGDAIYVVFEDALTAARCGVALQKVARKTDLRDFGCDARLDLRLGGHYGPVFVGRDYIRREPTFFGSHVTRAARIEPITPPGEVYVTEAMAAALALAGDAAMECDYVGIVPSAKGYGEMRMYVLKERGGAP